MFDDCWDEAVLTEECRRAASSARGAGVKRPAASMQKRPAASMQKRPAAKVAKPCGPKCGPKEGPTEEWQGKANKSPKAGPQWTPATPRLGAPRNGAVAAPKIFDKYANESAWPCSPDGPVIRLGSDCSGLDSPKVALDLMGLGSRVQLRFCSDKQKACRRFLEAVHAPEILYENANKAGSVGAPEVDLYTAGFPCQPWSSEGKGAGFQDASGQGRVSHHVAKYIKGRAPKASFFENVRPSLSRTTRRRSRRCWSL